MSAACFMRRVHLYALVTCWQTLSRVTFHVSHSGLSSQQGMLLPGQRNVLLRRCFMPNGWHCWQYAPNGPQRFRRFWRFHHETTNLHKPTISEKESKKRIFCILYIYMFWSCLWLEAPTFTCNMSRRKRSWTAFKAILNFTQMHRINYMKVSYMCIVCIVQIYTSF